MTIEEATHQLCAALHTDGINPSEITILLPREPWWRLYYRLVQLHQEVMNYDGRDYLFYQFQYMGIWFKTNLKSEAQL